MTDELFFPYLAYFEDIGFYYEGEEEGSHENFAFLCKDRPNFKAWLRLSLLIDETYGLEFDWVLQRGNLCRYIDKEMKSGINKKQYLVKEKLKKAKETARKEKEYRQVFSSIEEERIYNEKIKSLDAEVNKYERLMRGSLANYSLHDIMGKKYYNFDGDEQPESFFHNSYLLGIVSLIKMTRGYFETKLSGIISKESFEVKTPHIFRCYYFKGEDFSKVVNEKSLLCENLL